MAKYDSSNPFSSNIPGTTANTVGIGSLDSTRRLFNFGERVAELAPEQTPFFVYLSKVAKKATDDPNFKFLEQRHQWQRRNFHTHEVITSPVAGGALPNTEIQISCLYDKYGNVSTETAPEFILVNQTLAIKAKYDADGDESDAADQVDVIVNVEVVSQGTDTSSIAKPTVKFLSVSKADGSGEQALANGARIIFVDDWAGQVIGSSFAEATSYPKSWADELYAREGFTQIFKTAMPLMSGSAMATRYRGISNEWQRVWKEKLMEHKMDIEHSMLFGVGDNSTATNRKSWGIIPYVERYGKVYNLDWGNQDGTGIDVTETSSKFEATFDGLLGMFENFFAPEGGNSGQKLALCSRSVITYFNKINGFMAGMASATNPFNLDVNYKDGKFGHKIMEVNTIFGSLNLVQEPLFRGPYDDMMALVDMNNIAYRPLQGNGINRDTFIETNVQDNGMDGRIDQILTEAGLEVQLPETHAICKFSNLS